MKALSLLAVAGSLLSLNATAASAQSAPAATAIPSDASNAASAASLGATTPPPPASSSADDLARWRASYINAGHSALLGATAEAVEYAVGGTVDIRPSNMVRAWMRWEAFRPLHTQEGDVRSYTELVEVDCGDQRARLLAMDTFPFNNLQGAGRHHDAQDPQWAYPRPNTALEGEVQALCGVRDMAMLQLAAAAAAEQGQPQKPGLSSLALNATQPK